MPTTHMGNVISLCRLKPDGCLPAGLLADTGLVTSEIEADLRRVGGNRHGAGMRDRQRTVKVLMKDAREASVELSPIA